MRTKNMFSIKKFLPRTLFGRSLLILITPVLLIQVITIYIFFDRHWSKMTSRLAFAVAREISMIAYLIEDDDDHAHQQRIIDQALDELDLRVAFREGGAFQASDKKRQGYTWESMVAHSLYGELRAALKRPFYLDIDFHEKWIQVAVQLENGVLEVSLPGRRLFSSSGYIFLLWMIGTSLVLLVIAIIFMRNQIRPIRKLAIAAERFGKGRDVGAFRPSGAREVRQASEAFIDMHKRIRRQIEQRTTMLAGVSHDLRTPLTRMKLQLAMLGDSPDVDAMKADIAHMERMIEGYLEFVRGEGEEQVQYTDLRAMLERTVTAAKRLGMDAELNAPESLHIAVKPLAFERCLLNLANNAAKYAGKIWISAETEEGRLFIAIEDNGPGIPEDKFEDVFKPFYRVDSSRSMETGGVGLGLPIVMDIVHAHGGKIWLEKSAHGGLRVNIRLPL